MIDFIVLDSKITVDSDCSHEIKRHFAPWKESYDKPKQHVIKQRHHFDDKSPYSQSYVSSHSHVMDVGTKKADHQGTDAFEMLRVPCITKRSYSSILKEINPEYSLEGLMLKLKLQ